MPAIHFFSEDIRFTLRQKTRIKNWIVQIAALEDKQTGTINYIFCSDDYLLDINRQYLNHDYYTDIITFDHSENQKVKKSKIISGDIFISIDRVKDNAGKFGTSVEKELHRVMAHGVLHLIGYKDKSPKQQKQMRSKEDGCLEVWSQLF